MSTSIENLRRLAQRDVKDHTAIFDLYVTVGREVEHLAIRFGMDPDDVINLLEGYGEKLRCLPEDYDGDDPAVRKALEEFGIALDYSGKGRLHGLPRILVEEYVERFYPGIASEHPENDWICFEAYFDQMHPGWRTTIDPSAARRHDEDTSRKKKSRNKFRIFG